MRSIESFTFSTEESMAKDFVKVMLRRKTAEELVNALCIALADTSWGKDKGKGKGKKKDGGGDKYTPPKSPK
jgi:hypothetical protein